MHCSQILNNSKMGDKTWIILIKSAILVKSLGSVSFEKIIIITLVYIAFNKYCSLLRVDFEMSTNSALQSMQKNTKEWINLSATVNKLKMKVGCLNNTLYVRFRVNLHIVGIKIIIKTLISEPKEKQILKSKGPRTEPWGTPIQAN